MKIIDHAEVLRRLTPGVCIGLMRDCLADLEDGRATQYLRTVTPLPSGDIMGYMPAAVVTHVISRILTSRGQDDLKEIVLEAADTIAGIFAGDRHLDELMRIIHLAVELSENDRSEL